jgi:lactate permease
VVLWGLPGVRQFIASTTVRLPVPWLHQLVVRTPPVALRNTPDAAFFDIAWLETPGTPVFLAGLIAGPLLGLSLRQALGVFALTVHRIRYSLLAIVAMVCLGFLTRYSGMDAVMGLALTHTGRLFPLFGTFIGWIGVALSGTNSGSNALFGSLQVITANRLGINPVLMAAANSAGGVMGKMISAQSLIVACAATGLAGREGDLFRSVLLHSIVLTFLIGLIVLVYAYLAPGCVPRV